jgi:hypothetical protein
MKKLRLCLFIFGLFWANNSILAQDSLPKPKPARQWQYRVEPYLMFPNMSGQTGIEALPLVNVDASPADIFSRLQMGAMLNLEASNGNWSVISDILYMDLEQDITPSTLINSGEVGMKQFAWELAGLKRVTPWLELGIGGILNSIGVDETVTRNLVGGGTSTQSASASKTWVDPMLIARLATPSRPKKWFGQFRGEIGGFGIGSDFAWQVQAIGGYRFSKLFDMTVGYRGIGFDYQSGEGAKTFMYDMTIFGPMVRFGFNF